MRTHFTFGLSVFPISVTREDIEQGDSRSCSGCAVARALNRALPGLGFHDCFVEFVPYACWTEARGLEIRRQWEKPMGRLRAKHLPRGVAEWAMAFDEWAEFRDEHGKSLRSWREDHGKDADRPFPPSPETFLFNFGMMEWAGETPVPKTAPAKPDDFNHS